MGEHRRHRYIYDSRGFIRKTCEVCRKRQASEQWSLTACALGPLGWYAVCIFCDIRFNRQSLEFVGHPHLEQLMTDYVQRKRLAYRDIFTEEQFMRILEEETKCHDR